MQPTRNIKIYQRERCMTRSDVYKPIITTVTGFLGTDIYDEGNVEIFEGYFPSSNVAYYGDRIKFDSGHAYLKQGHNGRIEIDPRRIARLIDFDDDGNEVYEDYAPNDD